MKFILTKKFLYTGEKYLCIQYLQYSAEGKVSKLKFYISKSATAQYLYGLSTYSAILLQKNENVGNLFSVSLYQVATFSGLYTIYPNITVKCCTIKNPWPKHFPFCIALWIF
jgi:hypothetical protein